MATLSPTQSDLLNKVASGGQLRWDLEVGYHIVGQPGTYRNVTVRRLVGLGLLTEQPHDPEANIVDFDITPAGFDALGIHQADGELPKLNAEEEALLAELLAELQRLLTPSGEKPITAFGYFDDQLAALPPLPQTVQADILAAVRKRVPNFGQREGYFEAGILEYDQVVLLLLADPSERSYAAIFCDGAEAANKLLAHITSELGELSEAAYFPKQAEGEGA